MNTIIFPNLNSIKISYKKYKKTSYRLQKLTFQQEINSIASKKNAVYYIKKITHN